MITPDEIMIGNLFMFKGVEGWETYYDPKTRNRHATCFFFNFTNENWLDVNECVLDLNFVHPVSLGDLKNLPAWFGGNTFKTEVNGDGSVDVYAYRSGARVFIKSMAYVHEFQNLFYIITNIKFEPAI